MLKKKICKICGEECFSFKKHLNEKHNITEEDYYDTYLKKPGEGICLNCGKLTPRKSIILRGYKITCSENCHKIISVQHWRTTQNEKYNGKERTYIPDFKLITENGEEMIEIKGDYFFDKNGKFFDPYDKTEIGYYNAEQKYNCMINNGIKILKSEDLIELGIIL